MEQIAISKFKATCLGVLEQVRRTRKPVRVTRFGVPMAVIMPPQEAPPKDWMGSFASLGRINGDIVSPAVDEDDWDVLRP